MAAGLTIALVGCSDDFIEGENNGTDETSAYQFNAYIDDGNSTRTTMGELDNGKYPVLWSEGDKVFMFYGFNNKAKDAATLLTGSGTQKAVFKAGYWEKGTSYVLSVYPFEGANVGESYANTSTAWGRKHTITANIPQNQTYQKGTFTNNVFPMIGLCKNQYDFYYENMAGVLQLPVKGTGKISKVVLTGNNGEILAGEFTMSCICYKNKTDNSLTIDYLESSIAAGDKEAACGRLLAPVSGKSTGIITIDCGEDGLTLDPTTPTMINIVMMPKTFKKGFSVQFIDYDNGGSFQKSTTEAITVKRSYVKTMEEFDYTTPEPLEPANCYVADKVGYYLIPAFCMGNRPKNGRLDVSEDGTYNKTGNKVTADYLWTDNSGAISDIEYIPGKDGYISFKVNADSSGNAPRGNTVIALYDSVTNEILWSWHIWMSDYQEVATNGECRKGENTIDGFSSDAAKGHLIIMDRNLGATSADKNDGWKTYGLYYQMGRKDPFVGANSAGGDEVTHETHYDKTHNDKNVPTYEQFETEKFGDLTNHTEWNTKLAENGWTYNNAFITAEYGRQNPMEFASSWTKESQDTRWTIRALNQTEPFVSSGDHEDFWNRSKTINDPCPAGWTMLGDNSDLYGTPSTEAYFMADGVYGIEASYTYKNSTETSTIWWPASGFRSVDGTLGELGLKGYYWAFDHIDANHGGHGWYFAKYYDKKKGYYYKSNDGISDMTNHACVVRCVKAKQQ